MAIRKPYELGDRAHKDADAEERNKGSNTKHEDDEAEVLLEKEGHHRNEDRSDTGVQKVKDEAEDKETDMCVFQIFIPR